MSSHEQTVTECDQCKGTVVERHDGIGGIKETFFWLHVTKSGKHYHFCQTECLRKYFEEMEGEG